MNTASTNVAQVLLSIRHIYTNDKIMKKALCIEHGADIRYRCTKPTPTGG